MRMWQGGSVFCRRTRRLSWPASTGWYQAVRHVLLAATNRFKGLHGICLAMGTPGRHNRCDRGAAAEPPPRKVLVDLALRVGRPKGLRTRFASAAIAVLRRPPPTPTRPCRRCSRGSRFCGSNVTWCWYGWRRTASYLWRRRRERFGVAGLVADQRPGRTSSLHSAKPRSRRSTPWRWGPLDHTIAAHRARLGATNSCRR